MLFNRHCYSMHCDRPLTLSQPKYCARPRRNSHDYRCCDFLHRMLYYTNIFVLENIIWQICDEFIIWVSFEWLQELNCTAPLCAQTGFMYDGATTVIRRTYSNSTCGEVCTSYVPNFLVPPMQSVKCCSTNLCNNLVIYSSETPTSASERLHGLNAAQCQSETKLLMLLWLLICLSLNKIKANFI